MNEIRLDRSQVRSAAAIQQVIDGLGLHGGRVVLPAMELELDRGIELRSNVTLVGQGRDTVLRKAKGRVYPLSGYHNYGMCDVPLMHTQGLVPGMTVAIRDDQHGGFFETLARITWVENTWVGIDRGVHSDYTIAQNPVLVTAFPLIFGLGVSDVAVQGVTLDGNREAQPAGIGACRGAALYFIGSRSTTVTDVTEMGFAGEGLGFQMSRDVRIQDCSFANNTGNGYHPGAGSTGVVFENCVAEGNGAAGFFFCVRANHVSVRTCRFANNAGVGVSVGTRDSHNLLEACSIQGNGGAGILFRGTQRPVEPQSCWIRECRIEGNAHAGGLGQIVVLGDAHDLAFERNVISGLADRDLPGFYVAPSSQRLWLASNDIRACSPAIIADPAALVSENPVGGCGAEAVEVAHYRHLAPA
ncbi:MAG: right-handed parallel beta-helix repeat-containing protein [Anaerolineae bacterium]|nr:right-handed parallel beta-helix repeat-containing protein [Anaerolineae bacterium]